MIDIHVTDHGSVVVLEPASDAARDWVAETVEVPAWAWLGRAFAVDHRLAQDIIDGAIDAGLAVGQ